MNVYEKPAPHSGGVQGTAVGGVQDTAARVNSQPCSLRLSGHTPPSAKTILGVYTRRKAYIIIEIPLTS